MYHSSNYGSFYFLLGPVPYDGVTESQDVTVHPALSSIFIILSCSGIVFAIACLIFNFAYRKTK
jgi:hypothetical protein